MKVEDLKSGQKFEALHSRKGTILAVVKDNNPKNEFISMYLLEPVEGLVNSWEQGEELTCRKSFLSSIKVFDEKKKLSKFPIDKWRKEHWSMLAYCETTAVDNRGQLDLRRMSVNQGKRGFSNGNFPNEKWNPEYATRLNNGKKPDPSYDDIDVLDDLKAQGYLDYKFTCGKFTITMTPEGNTVCGLVRAHKTEGKNYNEFILPKKQAA